MSQPLVRECRIAHTPCGPFFESGKPPPATKSTNTEEGHPENRLSTIKILLGVGKHLVGPVQDQGGDRDIQPDIKEKETDQAEQKNKGGMGPHKHASEAFCLVHPLEEIPFKSHGPGVVFIARKVFYPPADLQVEPA